MPSFRVLDDGVSEERSEWGKIWEAWPSREVSAHPAYVRLFARGHDRSLCAVMADSGGFVLLPFILRSLTTDPWADGFCSKFDAATPYGYGGPFNWPVRTSRPEGKEFWFYFEEWARREGVVCLFARLSLFPEQMLAFEGEVETRLPNVVRTLELPLDAVWMEYEHKVRKNVKKAQRANLKVEVDSSGARLEEFLSVYYATMDRRGANETYYFPPDFFQSIITDLKGQFVFFHVLHEHRVVSTELVLVSSEYLYSFLGGTLAEAFDLRPNDLLKHAVISWGLEKGKKAFVLGGGYNGRDGIFQYKSSFAPHGEVPFRVGKRIYDVQAYGQLVKARRAWELQHNGAWEPEPGFFPAYRAPSVAGAEKPSTAAAKRRD